MRDNFSVTKLFMNKTITVFTDDNMFDIVVPTVREFYNNNSLNSVYHLWTTPVEELQSLYILPIKTSFQSLTIMIFVLGMYDKYRDIADKMREVLQLLLPQIDIDMASKLIKINGTIMTEEIWNYILYILKLSCGEKVNQPLTFDSEEARKFYMAQKAQEEKIAKMRRSNQENDPDSLSKILLSITYAFPSLTIDYLCNQTLAQIQWLQKYAAGAVSYEVNAQALAAGNMKKGSKLDFFIK